MPLSRRTFLALSASTLASMAHTAFGKDDARLRYPFEECGRWGYIDREGAVAIAPRFDLAWTFSDDLAPFKLAGHWGYIDRAGTEVIKARYDEARNFRYGLSPARVGDRWGFIRTDGTSPFSHDTTSPAAFRMSAPASG